MPALTIFAPAKLNLFLAVTGRRTDGFHDLVSLVAPMAAGDTLAVDVTDPRLADGGPQFSLQCTDPALAVDDSNLVLKAARAFAAETRWTGACRISLDKRIPIGAGLGGGSSDAAATLRALNALTGNPLDPAALTNVAAAVGSDCPLFLRDGPVVIRGRGERIAALPPAVCARLRGRRVLVFKPNFPVPTAWVYGRLAEQAENGATDLPSAYLSPIEAERRLAAWTEDPSAPGEALLFNQLESVVFPKYLALPTLLDRLRAEFGLAGRMTGSGSACFAFLGERTPVEAIKAVIHSSWGDSAYVLETHLA